MSAAMESHQFKRQMHQPSAPENVDPYVASLATVGMRIRKAVADGYSVNSSYSYNPQFGAQTGQIVPGPLPRLGFERSQLPAHLSAPPALTNDGSTFQSGLNVSEWGAPNVNVTTLPLMGTKRKFTDEPEYNDFKQYGGNSAYTIGGNANNIVSWDEFTRSNGTLKFDEEF